MKILIFMQELSGGGAERMITNLLNHLDKEKFTPLLIIGNDQVNDYGGYLDKYIQVLHLETRRTRHSFFKLRKIILHEKPDLILTTMNRYNIFVSLVNATLLWKRVPLILRESNNRTASGLVSWKNRLLTQFTYNYLSSAIITISEGVKQDLEENFHIKSNKITTIYNMVDIKLIDKLSREPIPDQNDWNRSDPAAKRIIAAGRLDRQKDYPTLLEAFRLVSTKCNATLTILGKGPLEAELKQLSQEMGLGDKVFFIGFQANPYQYMHRADVFVLTSKWEGFANVIVEALACGVPVVSTDCNSGPREILLDNRYGRLAPVGNPETIAAEIIEILQENHEELFREGIKRAFDFSADSIIPKYERIFINCVNNDDSEE